MAKPHVLVLNTADDSLQTWVLRVYIHCEGCKKKVYKVLQGIDGVYKVVVDPKEHKATVSGSVSGEKLVQKLLKSGKHAEILPESYAVNEKEPENDAGNQKNKKKKKKKKSNNKNYDVTIVDDAKNVDEGKTEFEDGKTDGNDVEKDKEKGEPNDNNKGDGKGDGKDEKDDGGGKKKKSKKNKGEKNDNSASTPAVAEGVPLENPENPPVVEAELAKKNVEASMEQLNLGHPFNPMVYVTPYDVPPYHNNMYYPTPGYGVSYSTSYPSAESSYYTPPEYGYAQSYPHPSAYYPPPPPPSYYHRRSAFDDHDDESEGKGYCAIM